MKHYFIVRVKWQSGAASVWVEVLEGIDTPKVIRDLHDIITMKYHFTTGILSVEYVTEEEALLIEEKPIYELNPEYSRWRGL